MYNIFYYDQVQNIPDFIIEKHHIVGYGVSLLTNPEDMYDLRVFFLLRVLYL